MHGYTAGEEETKDGDGKHLGCYAKVVEGNRKCKEQRKENDVLKNRIQQLAETCAGHSIHGSLHRSSNVDDDDDDDDDERESNASPALQIATLRRLEP
ncbi:hypothetical protein PAAG_04700 [Paracoccidioides lutzii Pb01]|uniref:Uncharacterized protein n=1 Tax=Paracoccidioides lutzii (strain ATCC MYA-826 / Pb01) TaxID=502779 RepID=C1H271_PARBA|nr:hypothetical protein PAAG_04700 [Paracoccidioides lutzii Pb01]EEH33651.2 hypothetical protein PAAG_04700 [Paracoccidioides lutzii Pb01]